MKKFKCSVCGETKTSREDRPGTGYGLVFEDGVTDYDKGKKVCYACCGKQDHQKMKDAKPGDRIVLYLSKESIEDHEHSYLKDRSKDFRYVVSNWPGTLSFRITTYKEGKHNIARSRVDVWFGNSEIGQWWGVQYGDWTQICHCRKLKEQK